MSTSINGSTGVTFPDASVQNTAATGFGFKSRIINGAMMIDQRNAGASVTASSTAATVYTLDRFWYLVSAASKMSIQQNVGAITPPAGFTNYLGVTSLSAYSVGASEVFCIGQNIEGLNIADFGWGTANAQPVTIGFWVRSSLTGTFSTVLKNNAANRSYPAAYTINSANTWEYKTITVAGDTSGTWLTNNGIGVRLYFIVGAGTSITGTSGAWAGVDYYGATGQTSVVGTNGATFYITGVQLEKGSTATSFDYRPYGTELALCERYFEMCVGGSYIPSIPAGAYFGSGVNFRTSKRAAPTVTRVSDTQVQNVNPPFGEVITINGFRAMTNATTTGGATFQTTYKAECEL